MSIAEVAKRAGVSNATISRVINHQERVADSTVASVKRAMEAVGYKPSANRPGPKVGSRRSTRVTNVLFLMFADRPGSTTTGFQRLVSGASSFLEKHNANLAVKFVTSRDDFHSLNLTDPRIDGILAHGNTARLGETLEAPGQVPTVWLMGNPVRPKWGDQVMPASDEIGLIAARHLVESGCNRLAHLNLLPAHRALRLHARAFLDAAEAMNVVATSIEPPPPLSDQLSLDADPSVSASIAEAADRLVDDLLGRHPKINGVFIAEDAQAAILIPALQRRGVDLSPGGDLAIVSCNNERPYLVGLNPCPPTIDIRFETIGRRGAAQLLWRIAERTNTGRMCTTVEPLLILHNTQGSECARSQSG